MATLQIEDLTTRTLTIVEVVTKTLLVSEGGGGGGGGSGSGTVTSVGITVPDWLSVSGSPITTSGTFAITASEQKQAYVLAAPADAAGPFAARPLLAGHLPASVAFQNAENTFTKAQTFEGQIHTDGIISEDKTAFITLGGNLATIVADNGFEISGPLSAPSLQGDGSSLTKLNASNIASGTVSTSHLPTSGVTAATYGSATTSPEIAVDKYGRITSAASKTISIAAGNVSGLATVATTGAYADLSGAPSLATVATSGKYTDLTDVPANLAALASLTGVADRGVYFTGAGALALFTQTSFARNLLDDADAATARGTLGINNPILSIDLPNGTYTILRSARHAFMINTAYGAIASAGSGTLTVSINGTPVAGLNAAAVTTTPADLTATAANTVSVGNVVTVTVAGLADNETIAATIQGTRT